MYLKYFGFSEASFSITPDPQYLFLSEQHREALAHLLYGAGENGGFVLLTGEVGTGKTTICRAFLEQTPEPVDVALVLNPALTAIELMQAICHEFGVATPDPQESAKVLVDRLNGFLLDAHARGRQPVVMIDEAQNLRPQVLEQVRLLTNLETAKQKLLQIFLIGQPELREILASRALRQLNQRITARFHLNPLSARETAAYVDHRITVAGVQRPLFSAAALREVYRRSRGVPRLINLICDRALLGAAVSRRLQVTPSIVRRAARELLGERRPQRQPSRRQSPLAMAAALVLALGLGGWLGGWLGGSGRLEQAWQRLDHARLVWNALQSDEPLAAGEAMKATGATAKAAAAIDATAGAAEAPGATKADEATAARNEAGVAGKLTAEDRAAAINATTNPATQGANNPAIKETTNPARPGANIDRERAVASARADSEQAAALVPAAPEVADASDAPEAPEAVIPRIALARMAPQVPEAALGELSELLLEEHESLPALLQPWGHAPDAAADCASVTELGLDCERSNERWSDLRLFDRPAVLELMIDGQPRHALITGIDDEYAVLTRGDRQRRVAIASLDERWSGDVLMLWRPPPSGTRLIGPSTTGTTVSWLRQRLAAVPDATLTDLDSPRYDADLQAAVEAFQRARGLEVDGIAGPRTLMLLNNALADSEIPRLSQSRTP
ncbi:MAG: AAA family ATPase [Halochromatium sp.]